MLIFTVPRREFFFMTVFFKPEAINESELKQCKSTAKLKLSPTTEPDSAEPSDVTWTSLACTEPKCHSWLCYYSSFLAILTRGKYHRDVGFWKDSHKESAQHNSPQWDSVMTAWIKEHWANWAIPIHSPNTAHWERELWQCSCDFIGGN